LRRLARGYAVASLNMPMPFLRRPCRDAAVARCFR
jgi:hypothetical protein